MNRTRKSRSDRGDDAVVGLFGLQALHLALDHVPLQLRQVVDEHLTDEVVELVLDGDANSPEAFNVNSLRSHRAPGR